jgi:hypothetical protein
VYKEECRTCYCTCKALQLMYWLRWYRHSFHCIRRVAKWGEWCYSMGGNHRSAPWLASRQNSLPIVGRGEPFWQCW